MPPTRSRKTGKFVRTANVWTPERWDEGYVDNKGRFRVYRPDFPKCYALGYALRAHVVWWFYNGVRHPITTELHHKNGDRLDDRLDNLVSLCNSVHQRVHKEKLTTLTCENCHKQFSIKTWKALSRKTRFCSQKCFHAYPRSAEHLHRMSVGIRRAKRKK